MWLIVLGFLLIVPEVEAARVLIDKQTGKSVNAFQSDPAPGVLLQNYLNNPGVGTADRYEEREVSEEEWRRLEEEVNGVERRRLQAEASQQATEPIEIPVGALGGAVAGALAALGVSTITGRKKKEPTP